VPLYEYRCAGCGREFEALVATAAKADQERCPGCGAEARRLLSLVAAPVRAAAPVAGGGCCGGACGHCG
jgi:putative FmdB family regulatory protein